MENARHAADGIRRRGVIQLFREYGGNAPGDNRPSFILMNTQAVRWHGLIDFHLSISRASAVGGDIHLARAYRIVDAKGKELAFREIERVTEL